MSTPSRVYLDNAATSWPKPECVYRAVEHAMRDVGAAAGRGAYVEAVQSRDAVDAARRAVARWIGAADARHVAFAQNGTDALNLALHGLLSEPGGHVVTTVVEHNSVLRPLAALADAGRIQVTRVGCDAAGRIDPAEVRRALRPNTRLVAVVHASNVTGAIQPVAEVADAIREHDALLLVDAAQTVGDLPIDVADWGVDLLAAPGHKGLLGPLGTGFLYIRPGVESRVAPVRHGGTGSFSDHDRQPEQLPDKYESGNLNVPALAGLAAGVRWLEGHGIEALRRDAVQRTGRLLDGLCGLKGLRIFGPPSPEQRVAVVSITLEGYDPQELATMLDAAFRVQVRAGLHCAPWMHRSLGTRARGGTVRFSLGPLNTDDHVDAAVAAVAEIAAQTTVA